MKAVKRMQMGLRNSVHARRRHADSAMRKELKSLIETYINCLYILLAHQVRAAAQDNRELLHCPYCTIGMAMQHRVLTKIACAAKQEL